MNRTTAFAVVLVTTFAATVLGGCASTGPEGARALVGFGVESSSRSERATDRMPRADAPPFKSSPRAGR